MRRGGVRAGCGSNRTILIITALLVKCRVVDQAGNENTKHEMKLKPWEWLLLPLLVPLLILLNLLTFLVGIAVRAYRSLSYFTRR